MKNWFALSLATHFDTWFQPLAFFWFSYLSSSFEYWLIKSLNYPSTHSSALFPSHTHSHTLLPFFKTSCLFFLRNKYHNYLLNLNQSSILRTMIPKDDDQAQNIWNNSEKVENKVEKIKNVNVLKHFILPNGLFLNGI